MVAITRGGTLADAIAGTIPRLVFEPATVEEAAEALAACARDRLRVGFVGGGTELELGAPPTALDVVLRTRRLARTIEHVAADQIVVVEAGVPLAELQRRLAPHGQRLALDPPLPERATVGGIVAANAHGPRRHRFGASRDLVVGMTLVRADGAIAKGGGKVVKNVAGFDVPRLLVGSLGTLALVATLTFRLHPLPECESTVLLRDLAKEKMRALVVAIQTAQLEPSSVVALEEDGRLRLAARFEGFAPGVAQQLHGMVAMAKRMGLGAEPLDETSARAFWSRHDAVRTLGRFRARLAALPSLVDEMMERALRPLLGVLCPGMAALYPTLGLAFVSGEPTSSRASLARRGGTVILTAATPTLRERCEVWGSPPAGLSVMRRMKDQFDPEHRLAPGRFVGGI